MWEKRGIVVDNVSRSSIGKNCLFNAGQCANDRGRNINTQYLLCVLLVKQMNIQTQMKPMVTTEYGYLHIVNVIHLRFPCVTSDRWHVSEHWANKREKWKENVCVCAYVNRIAVNKQMNKFCTWVRVLAKAPKAQVCFSFSSFLLTFFFSSLYIHCNFTKRCVCVCLVNRKFLRSQFNYNYFIWLSKDNIYGIVRGSESVLMEVSISGTAFA